MIIFKCGMGLSLQARNESRSTARNGSQSTARNGSQSTARNKSQSTARNGAQSIARNGSQSGRNGYESTTNLNSVKKMTANIQGKVKVSMKVMAKKRRRRKMKLVQCLY